VTATPPRADLRTLAAEALDSLPDCPPDHWGGRDILDPCVDCQANAVLAAVLPEHRRMVLTEAADAAERALKAKSDELADGKRSSIHPTRHIDEGIGAAKAIGPVRQAILASAAPPAGLSAPVPAGTAPAVPEEADGQRVAEGPYRVGRKVGRTIYRMAGNEPSDTDELIGVMDSPALAAFAVRGMNAETRGGRVPLADVLDALRDEDAYHRWRKALTGARPEYPPLTTRHHLADYLVERFAPTTAPEGEQ
jgi:hypothetical protein